MSPGDWPPLVLRARLPCLGSSCVGPPIYQVSPYALCTVQLCFVVCGCCGGKAEAERRKQKSAETRQRKAEAKQRRQVEKQQRKAQLGLGGAPLAAPPAGADMEGGLRG